MELKTLLYINIGMTLMIPLSIMIFNTFISVIIAAHLTGGLMYGIQKALTYSKPHKNYDAHRL